MKRRDLEKEEFWICPKCNNYLTIEATEKGFVKVCENCCRRNKNGRKT